MPKTCLSTLQLTLLDVFALAVASAHRRVFFCFVFPYSPRLSALIDAARILRRRSMPDLRLLGSSGLSSLHHALVVRLSETEVAHELGVALWDGKGERARAADTRTAQESSGERNGRT